MEFANWKDDRWIEQPDGGRSRTAQFEKYLGNMEKGLREYKIIVAASDLRKWQDLQASFGNPTLVHDIFALIEKACEELSGSDRPEDLPYVSRAAHWRFRIENLTFPNGEPEKPVDIKFAKPRCLPLDDLNRTWGFDVLQLMNEIRPSLTERSRKEFAALIERIMNGPPDSQRGHAFELKTISELDRALLGEVVLEEQPLPKVMKKFDIGFPARSLHVELYSPEKDPMAVPMIELEDDEDVIQQKNNMGFFCSGNSFADHQVPAFLRAVVRKSRSKADLFTAVPGVLVVDGFYNAIGRDHTTGPVENWARCMKEEFGRRVHEEKHQYPDGIVAVLKWYAETEGKSLILPFFRSDDERDRFEGFRAVMAADKIRLL